MKISFLSTIVMVLLTLPVVCFTQITSPDFEIKKLADGIYAAVNKPGGRAICNAGIVDLGKETLVFDPFISPYAAEELQRVIREMGLPPVKYVVNSHYHDDHIRGNMIFKNASIYSTLKTRDLIAETEPEEFIDEEQNLPRIIAKSDSILSTISASDTMNLMEQKFWNGYYKTILESHQILKTVLPDKIVNGKETISGSNQTVELIDMGMGHTESDLILYIPTLKIMFTGDLLFVRNHPWIADANLDSLKNCLIRIKTIGPSVLVPGHGPVGDMQDIDILIQYLVHINQVAENNVNKGLKPEDVKEVLIPSPYRKWLLARFYLPNIKFQMEQRMDEKNKTSK